MDIYYIIDSEYMLNLHSEHNFAGRFDLKEFKIIQCFLSEEGVNFFQDFQLKSKNLEIIYQKLLNSELYQSTKNRVSAVLKLENICIEAINKQAGIVGYCD
jgi:hypothetical protein